MFLDELESICKKYDCENDYKVEPFYFKEVISRIGPINWHEFLSVQTANIYNPNELDDSKFKNFAIVADPASSVNSAIFQECLTVTESLADGGFSSFKSESLAWGFIYFLLANLQDVA